MLAVLIGGPSAACAAVAAPAAGPVVQASR